jgi:cobalamin biosynthesis protein CobD/CbiB
MDLFLSSIQSRADDVFIAFATAITFQIVTIVISLLTKRTILPLPIIEHCIRPTAITLIDKLNREGRSDFALIIRGSIVFTVLFILILGAGIIIEAFLIYTSNAAFMGSILLFLALSPLSFVLPVLGISSDKTRAGQYRTIAQALNQNLVTTDKHGLRRASYKTLAVGLSQWVIGPILFYLLGGLILTYLYVTLSIFTRVTSQRHKIFLSLYGIIYKIMNILVSVVSVLFVGVGACFSAGGKPLSILNAFKDASNMVESAFAHSQNITLGGAGQDRHGQPISTPWFGADNATAKLDHNDVLRGIIQYCITLFLVGVVLFALWGFR